MFGLIIIFLATILISWFLLDAANRRSYSTASNFSNAEFYYELIKRNEKINFLSTKRYQGSVALTDKKILFRRNSVFSFIMGHTPLEWFQNETVLGFNIVFKGEPEKYLGGRTKDMYPDFVFESFENKNDGFLIYANNETFNKKVGVIIFDKDVVSALQEVLSGFKV